MERPSPSKSQKYFAPIILTPPIIATIMSKLPGVTASKDLALAVRVLSIISFSMRYQKTPFASERPSSWASYIPQQAP
ncbi:hypothetical protein F511_38130 [Dorcoceras hygrometricum]|uniref:Uncharacterized protein n=1 Tax=Dorcoceras hygrometricum TaxID=472368 RepID=A0A2Z7AGW7_9LAMI|nr:hypothetical protein F511_38130 [Dorcoceras hygrometricum]